MTITITAQADAYRHMTERTSPFGIGETVIIPGGGKGVVTYCEIRTRFNASELVTECRYWVQRSDGRVEEFTDIELEEAPPWESVRTSDRPTASPALRKAA